MVVLYIRKNIRNSYPLITIKIFTQHSSLFATRKCLCLKNYRSRWIPTHPIITLNFFPIPFPTLKNPFCIFFFVSRDQSFQVQWYKNGKLQHENFHSYTSPSSYRTFLPVGSKKKKSEFLSGIWYNISTFNMWVSIGFGRPKPGHPAKLPALKLFFLENSWRVATYRNLRKDSEVKVGVGERKVLQGININM